MSAYGGCTIDTLESTGSSGGRTTKPGAPVPKDCVFNFNASSGAKAFSTGGTINSQSPGSSGTLSAITTQPATTSPQWTIALAQVRLGVFLVTPTYETKTIQAGNPQFWIEGYFCAGYFSACGLERFVAGEFNGTLRGSGTLTLTQVAGGQTQILINATLPAENTSVSQTMQLQNLQLNEICTYVY